MARSISAALLSVLPLIASASCKHSKENYSQKIINGEIAKPDHWTVATMVALTNDGYIATGNSYCSGTVIAPYAVLTAAHCMSPRYDDGWHQIVWGPEVLGTAQKRRVNKRVQHPEYKKKPMVDGEGPYHDLAIYLFNDGLPMGFAQASLVDPKATYQNGEIFFVAGYGNTKEGANVTDTGILRWTEVKLERTSDMENELYLVGDDNKNTCKGDSGGPVYKQRLDSDGMERYELAGITSYGKGCSDGSGHYVDIRAYRPWIDDVLRQYKERYVKKSR